MHDDVWQGPLRGTVGLGKFLSAQMMPLEETEGALLEEAEDV